MISYLADGFSQSRPLAPQADLGIRFELKRAAGQAWRPVVRVR